MSRTIDVQVRAGATNVPMYKYVGLPSGGNDGDVITKNSPLPYDVKWAPPAGGGPGGSSYTHTQSSSSDTWTVNHNLGYRPTITVFDASGAPVGAGIAHSSINQAIISFVIPLTGSARCT